jgi:hypothetical protein
MRLRLCALIVLLFTCVGLHALMTAEELVNRCKVTKQKTMSNDDMMDYMYCTGYITGFTQATDQDENTVDMNSKPLTRQKTVCLPAGAEISADELVLVFLKFTDDHPEVLHEDASIVVHNALVKAYSCKKVGSAP